MKITHIETIRSSEHPNILWIEIHTDESITGVGETFFGAAAVEAYIHEFACQKLIGADPLEMEKITTSLIGYLGFSGSGVEMRGNSAIDIALWDLYAKSINKPIYQALGGKSRDQIRTYNTCAGSHYVRSTQTQSSKNWGLGKGADQGMGFDDLNAFLNDADELALSLLEDGITAMKIWPFDKYAEASNGSYISGPDLEIAIEPFRKIRNAVGNKMDIMVEFHSLWNLPMAIKIAERLEEFDTFWHEDPIKMDGFGVLSRYAQKSKAPLCVSETLGGKRAFKELLETNAAGVIMLDLSWCGGLSEARKIAAMADAYHLPIAPHDCTGPVVLAASTHLSLHAPNALVQESVRAFYNGWYKDYVTDLPQVSNGLISVSNAAGLGLSLLPDVKQRDHVEVKSTK
ncbi:MAG: mandelate racemase/muconate lactonizing enzyme family protein [Kordiimonadaceae bacterium]|nr:mandelate racemase/muconate lactonizing enzyme family protein [Kordiimonadaceae bacterium]